MSEMKFVPLKGGGNNRGFRVEGGKKPFFVKVYVRYPNDKRDRLGAEFGFCQFLWDQGIRTAPQPMQKDKREGFGVYEFIEGRLLGEKDITPARVKEAVKFFVGINRRRTQPAAKKLSKASEACFSINEHLKLVQGRVDRLKKMKPKSATHREAIRFVKEELVPRWHEISKNVRDGARLNNIKAGQSLAQSDRCLSPSDFGFHNTILTKKGKLRFIDFEYAGWDDPAKTLCDFALQPRLRFPPKLVPLFAKPVLRLFGNDRNLRTRTQLLYPVFAIKWCCIILNGFMRETNKNNLEKQLAKSRKFMSYTQENYGLR